MPTRKPREILDNAHAQEMDASAQRDDVRQREQRGTRRLARTAAEDELRRGMNLPDPGEGVAQDARTLAGFVDVANDRIAARRHPIESFAATAVAAGANCVVSPGGGSTSARRPKSRSRHSRAKGLTTRSRSASRRTVRKDHASSGTARKYLRVAIPVRWNTTLNRACARRRARRAANASK